MRLRNPRVQLIIALAVLLIVFFAFSYNKVWPKQGNKEPEAVSGPTIMHPNSPVVSAVPTAPVVATNNESVTTYPTEHIDVVVIGSELEGLYLARAAADEGLKVKILDPHKAFGGQILQSQMLFLDETRDDQGHLLVQGRVKELFDGFRNAKIRKLPEFTTYMNKLMKDIPLESGIVINEIEQTNTPDHMNKISSIVYSTEQNEKKKITASYWVDNSDYAALISRLDAKRLPGLEKFYGQKEIEYMSAGMMMKFKNVDWKKFNTAFNLLKPEEKSKQFGGGYVSDSFAIGLSGMTKAYHPTNDRVFLRGLNAVNQRDGEVLINALLVYTVDPSKPESILEAVSLGNKETPLILNHFRKTLPGWEHAELGELPTYPYVREYNHYEMDYVLKPSDLLSGTMFWDNVSIGGYPLDLQGTSANKWGIEMGRPDKYGMPLRSFLLKNYDNVIAAGKNVGSSAIAYGSTRIQPNTSLAAESIGVILGQLHGKQKLREITPDEMAKLQQYLALHYQIKLTGVVGTNKIIGWNEEEIRKLDSGEITYPSYIKTRKKPAVK
ncbi:FAD-dependent oxidoreductase [Paenibacillus alginolyticus]|uniref:FAD-dependent oxidoreductase n=1 Tax=Paenibacillus alginolyticus TaxID=59839 RepID=A0ABT4GFK2_9BACL|nr:FAD-dependent oxidoreductase [Paenibacillus alginolyticus]MCY9669450.1 FAD-dependent oxidoreductase [Paenibacillus alginolyticus]MCY9694960.1 FAD-dependent oxidoreductase [Paenibacillus alginolyticus]MEC0148958.1 FAD-dependent oxidoreductase [Paenibacillus alginolyticus]